MAQEELDYRDFEIEIAPSQANRYPVAVLRSPSGQARNMMRLPFEQTTPDQHKHMLEKALLGEIDDPTQAVQSFGGQLFEASPTRITT